MGSFKKIVAMIVAVVLIAAMVAFILKMIIAPGGGNGEKQIATTNQVAPAHRASDPPPLELARQDAESQTADMDKDGVRISSGFECSTPVIVQKLSATHFEIDQPRGPGEWFLFRMEGIAGKTIRIDLNGRDPASSAGWMTSLNPVFTYAKDLDDVSTYSWTTADSLVEPTAAWNGPLLPATDAQQWHYMANVWTDKENKKINVSSFVQHFDSDAVYIAQRVPYPPGYNEHFFQHLSSNPLAKVYEIGRSRGNRPLLLAKIGSGGQDSEQKKPCILVYAGEHADEQDGMWVAQGVVDHLLSDDAKARLLRDQFTFLVIPMVDPDTLAAGRHFGVVGSAFMTNSKTPESVAYANWFQSWINSGKRLDLVFDLGSVGSKGHPHVSCAVLESIGVRGESSEGLHSLILKGLEQAGVGAAQQPWLRGWSPDRLGGWLSRRYGPVGFAYELNCQASDRHLNLQQLTAIGGIFADAMPEFFSSPDGLALISEVDSCRQERLARWAKHGPMPAGTDAIDAEAEVSKGVGIATTQNSGQEVENWIP